MPYDAGAVYAVAAELNAAAAGARIEKITQVLRDEIVLSIYNRGEHRRISLDINPGGPKVYMTSQNPESLPAVTNFCSVLRKYIQNARITSVAPVGFDRVLEFTLEAFDEMGFARPLTLYAECIRKQANLILTGGERKIISAARIVDLSVSQARQILPGLMYMPPDGFGRKNPLGVQSRDEFAADIGKTPEKPLEACLIGAYNGFSPLVARELAYLAARDTGAAVADIDIDKAWFHFSALMRRVREGSFSPCLITDAKDAMIEFCYTDIRQYGTAAKVVPFESASALVEFFCGKKDFDNKLRQKSQDILKVLTIASQRLTRRLQAAQQELADCAGKDKNREYGDLITANIYRIKKGMAEAEVENYFSEGEPIAIPLDVNLAPQQNAQRYYRKYNKQKTAEFHLKKQIESARSDLDYIDSVFESLTRALSERELAEIREELRESGFIRAKDGEGEKKQGKKPQRKLPVSKPAEYVSPGGLKILCGRNNRQNDSITFGVAAKNDIWFHAQNIPGSHVLLLCDSAGHAPSDEDINAAALIAAQNSKAKNSPIVSVDYAPARYVKKPAGAKPGFVVYTNYKTAIVRK